MLLANNICFNRENREIIKNISITISPGKIIHLSGNNGVGKTTLLKILSNIIKPEKGDIFWNGKNIKKNPYNLYKDLTYIMENKTAHDNLTVYENIFFWQKIFSSKIKKREIDSILELLFLSSYKNTLVRHLSYGEIKKLELSRLIIEQKTLWILDEPYIGLDIKSVELINETIINHAKLGGMAIFTSHIYPNIGNLETINLLENA